MVSHPRACDLRALKRIVARLTFFVGDDLVDVRWQHAVVVEVVEVLRLLRRHGDLLEPLDHAAADVAGDNHAAGKAVVRRKQPACQQSCVMCICRLHARLSPRWPSLAVEVILACL